MKIFDEDIPVGLQISLAVASILTAIVALCSCTPIEEEIIAEEAIEIIEDIEHSKH